MSSGIPSSAELGKIAGPMLIGYILNWGFFGILAMQVYVYYLAFPKDPVRSKALVYTMLILELAQTILFTSSAFKMFATGFGNAAVLDHVDLLWFSIPVMSGLVAFVAQVFYASQIASFKISESKYLSGLVALLASLQLGGAIALGIQTKNAVVYSRLIGKGSLITSTLWQGSTVACNLVIAVCMLHSLNYKNILRATAKGKSNLITKALRIVVESGSLTATIALLTLILSLIPGRPKYYQASISVLAKLYSNSIMVGFNSRMKIISAANRNTVHDQSMPLPPTTGQMGRGGTIRRMGSNIHEQSEHTNFERSLSTNMSSMTQYGTTIE